MYDYVRSILQDIKENGMTALLKYSQKFDGFSGPFPVSQKELVQISISPHDAEVIDAIVHRVKNYHSRQEVKSIFYTQNDSEYGLLANPISRIGIYVPSGKSVLVSTLIMTAVPAMLAGVSEIAVACGSTDGQVDPFILYTAKKLGINELYKISGVQAIAAMAYGVGMKKTEKIFGPGNAYVTAAKQYLYGTVGIDCLAGPSEVCVLADGSSQLEYIMSDLQAQLEHGDDSRAYLITTSSELCRSIESTRITKILCSTIEECIQKVNEIAPEHLELMVQTPEKYLPYIRNAGAVYCGDYSPTAASDYFSGSNHVLPTDKTARFSSVLTVYDFIKFSSYVKMSRREFLEFRHLGIRMSEIEKMAAHKKSLEVRQ
ncbi:MAG TPA: histidinol dehydrogenase [Petrotogaceae bacterium]|mgnify:CR=1 FL=1|jgi:histidinol dehydrogenase|nr:histidinol dehydrogenase [Petrotogaceae bacterium]HNV06262.1 histidinol dehydrogenase [Petrotogaceae bacterium]